MKYAWLAGLAGFASGFFACGPTKDDVLTEYRERFSAKRGQLLKILESLPPPGSVQENVCRSGLNPAPVYDARQQKFNTEIAMADQLANPDANLSGRRELDLLLSTELIRALRWTGPRNPMSDETRQERAGTLAAELERALGYSYLIVLRPLDFTRPVAVDERRFQAGSATLEGFLVDLRTNEVVGSFKFSAETDERVPYTYERGTQDARARLEDWAYSNLFTNLRLQLEGLLRTLTGGTLVLERSS